MKDPLSINLDSELFKTNKLYFHAIAADKSSNIKGFPQNAYGYGALITGKISNSYQDSWGNFQIYIPHNGSNNSEFPIYIRTSGDGSGSGAFSWRRIDAKTTVMANT
ncbi:hypothetical protein FYJ38_09875 [Clostridium sp. WB02_MRS01]|uniref:hypothetical protein n=1 Tax=Clostridium sp. WB02_MRS01 TaxID=2605777 RepID=UPI0012B38233|nr:hypothetical protein [Clostridium sp. WB02_MRS01]MSS08949.1 hypothetical protein [Clostridium sp. WB02_MRS01]